MGDVTGCSKMPYMNVYPVAEDVGIPGKTVGQALTVNGSGKVYGGTEVSSNGTDFLSIYDVYFEAMLMSAKKLRDMMREYTETKQALGWALEVNALQKNRDAIKDRFIGACLAAAGGLGAGLMMGIGGGVGAYSGNEIWSTIANGSGQLFNNGFTIGSGSENREADTEKAVADLESLGAQSYNKTMDDLLVKASEVMQQKMQMGLKFLDDYGAVLHAITR